jgi:hypothetical protein
MHGMVWLRRITAGTGAALVAVSVGAQAALAQQKGTSPAVAAAARDTRPATAADSMGIREAALNYIEGWYAGDAQRMEKALHPELAKRIVRTDPATGRSNFSSMSALTLINGTRAGGGTKTPAANRRTDVRILDIFEGAAVARVDASDWVDYLQLARWNGSWVIVNVLWELRPREP